MKVATGLRARERVVVHVDSRAARWISALAVLSLSGWLLVLHKDLAWSLTILAGVVLIARGIFLGRPVTAGHATAALVVLIAGLAAVFLAFDLLGNVLMVASAVVLMSPTSARPNPADLPRIFALVNATTGDPLAPFAMQRVEVLPLQPPTAPRPSPTAPGWASRWSAAIRSVTTPDSLGWSQISPRCAIRAAGALSSSAAASGE